MFMSKSVFFNRSAIGGGTLSITKRPRCKFGMFELFSIVRGNQVPREAVIIGYLFYANIVQYRYYMLTSLAYLYTQF